MQRTFVSPQVHAQRPFVPATRPSTRSVVVRSTGWADPAASGAERTLFGENLGARDPTAGELASNFSDKVLGNFDTEHIIKVPTNIKNLMGLVSRSCTADTSKLSLLAEKDLELYRNQVPGWRMTKTKEGTPCLRFEWSLKDAAAAEECVKRVKAAAEADAHVPEMTTVGNTVVAELTTKALGGITENDLIVAAKVNEVSFKDILAVKKARYWA